MSNESIVEKLEEYNIVSSWLLWGEEFQRDESTKKYIFKVVDINSDYVFVALNPSSKKDLKMNYDWGSFHTNSCGVW